MTASVKEEMRPKGERWTEPDIPIVMHVARARYRSQIQAGVGSARERRRDGLQAFRSFNQALGSRNMWSWASRLGFYGQVSESGKEQRVIRVG